MNEPDSLNPYSVATSVTQVSSDEVVTLPAGMTRGLVNQIPIVGVLMVVQGVLELVMALVMGGYIWFLPQLIEELQREAATVDPEEAIILEQMSTWMTVIGVAGTIAAFAIGVMTIIAGVNVYRYRTRTFAIVVLGAGLLMIFTCYCFPTALGIAIYGLIVMLNPSVKFAFDLVARGHAVRDVQRAFALLP